VLVFAPFIGRDLRVAEPILQAMKGLTRLACRQMASAFAEAYLEPMWLLEECGRVKACDPLRRREADNAVTLCTSLLSELYGNLIAQACEATGWERTMLLKRLDAFAQFEPLLYDSDANYRDHLVHALTTCLLGLVIIDHCIDLVAPAYNRTVGLPADDRHTIEAVWILTSLLHDVGYGVERFRDLLASHVMSITGLGCEGGIDFMTLLGAGGGELSLIHI
jgi:hypothetical protein